MIYTLRFYCKNTSKVDGHVVCVDVFYGEEENLFGSHQRGRQTRCDVVGDTLSLSRYMNGNHSRVLAS